jgi:hypothetical protein
MNGSDEPRPRGRPSGPSLSRDAMLILSRNAFMALRGPNSRGAVPRGAFTNVDASTVDRSVEREFGTRKDKAPFDLAVRYLYDLDTSGLRDTMRLIYEPVNASLRETDNVVEAARAFLRANYISASTNEGILASFLVQIAACSHLEHRTGSAETESSSKAASELIDIRQAFYDEMTNEFAAALTIALRRLRRRPKANYSVEDIVLAITAASDGFVILYKLHPNRVTPDLVAETEWAIAWGMSEPGLLDPPDQSRSIEGRLVEQALRDFSSGQVPSLTEQLIEFFPTLEALAQRCMDYAVGSSLEIHNIANGVKGAEVAAIRNLLIAITELAETAPLLTEIIGRDRERGFCAEARSHISEGLSQAAEVGLDARAAAGVAQMLLDSALKGAAGESIWKSGLDGFGAKSP